MQKEIEIIEIELVQRIYKLFIIRYDGNKSAFAKASNCTEATIRRIFKNEQGITINLLLRISFALDIPITELLKDLDIRR